MEVVRTRLLMVESGLVKLGFTRVYRWKVPSTTPNKDYLIQVCPSGHLLVLTSSMAKQISKGEACYECCSFKSETVQSELNKRIDEISRYDVLLHKLIWSASTLNDNSGSRLNIAFRNNKKASEAFDSFTETKQILSEITGDEEEQDVVVGTDLTMVNGNYAMLIHRLSAEVDKLRLQLQLQKLDQVQTIMKV